MKKTVLFSMALGAIGYAHAAGFGLYEMSARSMMTGGHSLGRAGDASAVYYNPATISGLTGTWVTVGITAINPPLDTRVNGEGTHKMNPGWFPDPHAFITQELPWGFTAGLGFYADTAWDRTMTTIGRWRSTRWRLWSKGTASILRCLTRLPTSGRLPAACALSD